MGGLVDVVEGVEAVGVDDGSRRRPGHEAANCCPLLVGSTQARSDDDGLEAVELVEDPVIPSRAGKGTPDDLQRPGRGLEPGHAEVHEAGAGTQCRAAAHLGRAGHARRPGGHPDRALPLVGVALTPREPRGDVRPLDEGGTCA